VIHRQVVVHHLVVSCHEDGEASDELLVADRHHDLLYDLSPSRVLISTVGSKDTPVDAPQVVTGQQATDVSNERKNDSSAGCDEKS
jgi:hypothetical protein